MVLVGVQWQRLMALCNSGRPGPEGLFTRTANEPVTEIRTNIVVFTFTCEQIFTI